MAEYLRIHLKTEVPENLKKSIKIKDYGQSFTISFTIPKLLTLPLTFGLFLVIIGVYISIMDSFIDGLLVTLVASMFATVEVIVNRIFGTSFTIDWHKKEFRAKRISLPFDSIKSIQFVAFVKKTRPRSYPVYGIQLESTQLESAEILFNTLSTNQKDMQDLGKVVSSMLSNAIERDIPFVEEEKEAKIHHLTLFDNRLQDLAQ